MKATNNITYGLYIASSSYNNKTSGLIVNSVMQLSVEPDIICVCINKKSYTHTLLENSNNLGITILSNTLDKRIFDIFGFMSGKDINKFSNFDYSIIDDVPILNNNAGYMTCKIVDKINIATHTLFIGKIISNIGNLDNTPLTYKEYQEKIKNQL